jgi:hypothetical protein
MLRRHISKDSIFQSRVKSIDTIIDISFTQDGALTSARYGYPSSVKYYNHTDYSVVKAPFL